MLHRTQGLEQGCYLAFLSQVAYAQIIQRGQLIAGRDISQCLLKNLINRFHRYNSKRKDPALPL